MSLKPRSSKSDLQNHGVPSPVMCLLQHGGMFLSSACEKRAHRLPKSCGNRPCHFVSLSVTRNTSLYKGVINSDGLQTKRLESTDIAPPLPNSKVSFVQVSQYKSDLYRQSHLCICSTAMGDLQCAVTTYYFFQHYRFTPKVLAVALLFSITTALSRLEFFFGVSKMRGLHAQEFFPNIAS